MVAKDQIRTVIRTFRDNLFTEIFPGRSDVPKTLIFAKDDSHAEDIVKIVREEFGRGNDFCQKITYKTTGKSTDDLIAEFRNSYNPRIVVTVDMIATGTDIKPLEIVFFMRSVRSAGYFDQMKGRGVRVIDNDSFQAVTSDAKAKTHFVIVDAVGVCDSCKTDMRSLESKPSVSLEKLLESIAFGNEDEDIVSTVAFRLKRLERRLSPEQRNELEEASNGLSLTDIVKGLVKSLDPDTRIERARAETGSDQPSNEQVNKAGKKLIDHALTPLRNPTTRNKIIELKRSFEQTIDTVSLDEVLSAGFDEKAKERASSLSDLGLAFPTRLAVAAWKARLNG